MKTKKQTKISKKPKVGDEIYVESSFYISHGEDDFCGGLAKISKISKEYGTTFVEVVERPSHGYNYEILMENQEQLKKQFGKKRAHPDPDINTPWIEKGDIVDGKVV